jgi:hypothetical protein
MWSRFDNSLNQSRTMRDEFRLISDVSGLNKRIIDVA